MRRFLELGVHFLRYRWREVHPYEVQAVLLNACNLRCIYCRCPEMDTAQERLRQLGS